MNRRLLFFITVISLLIISQSTFATNGMNMEGYGPISVGMGGASMAYDNGTAATMNNPATLALMKEGFHIDFALGMLGPDVDATMRRPGSGVPEIIMTEKSSSDAFYIPALGLIKKSGRMAYGFGIFGQGGMGTEYARDSWMADPSGGQNSALEEGLVNRSEISIGRILIPFTYDLNEKLSFGFTFDFVWAGMDIQMAMSESQFRDLANPEAQTIGTVAGSMAEAFGAMYEPFGSRGISQLHHAYFDFSNDSDFTGEAKGTGIATKLGLVYKLRPDLTVGATYHSKTSLSDFKTDNAKMQMAVNIDPAIFEGQFTGTYVDTIIPIRGNMTVKDFQWPATFGFGVAYQPMEKLIVACDVKFIRWSGAMKDFKMTFSADSSAANAVFANLEMDAVLFQKWDDQIVFSIGSGYKVIDALTLRAGFNSSKNPIPDKYLNALFPAIVENHLTFGAGYDFSESSSLNFSVTKAFETKATNPGNGVVDPMSTDIIPAVESTHNQFNWMVMYSHHF